MDKSLNKLLVPGSSGTLIAFRTYVSNIRSGVTHGIRAVINSRPGGYRLGGDL